MRQRLFGVMAVSLFSVGPAGADPATDLTGDWATPGLGAVVRIGPCVAGGQTLCGTYHWAWNPNDAKALPIGGRMIDGLVFRDGAWQNGKLTSPEDGRVYRGEITQVSRHLIRLRGCAGPFCQTQTWRRLSSIPRPD